jgi:hypothetical protein
MAGLVPAIHVLTCRSKDVDAREIQRKDALYPGMTTNDISWLTTVISALI